MVGGVPAIVERRGPLKIVSSMPYGTYGGLVLRPEAREEAARALLGTCDEIANRPGTAALHLVDISGRLPRSLPGYRGDHAPAHVVRLDRSYEDIEHSFKASLKNKIRKAQRAGVSIRRASGERDFLSYRDMLIECSRRWGARCPFTREFFASLSTLDPSKVQMWLAEHNGEIVGGDLNFAMNGRVMNWGSVTRERGREVAATTALHAFTIRTAVEDGCRVYDLGTSLGMEGVEAYKAAFGTERTEILRFRAEKPWFAFLRRVVKGEEKRVT